MSVGKIVPRLAMAALHAAPVGVRAMPVAASRVFPCASAVRYQSSSSKEEPISTEPPPEENGSRQQGADQSSSGSAGNGDKAAKLEAEVADLRKKMKEINESRAYLLAEMENVRRIAKTDVDKAKQYAAQPIAKALLLAVDNLSMAVASIPADKKSADPAFGNLANGVEATLKIFMKVLAEHGTTEFGKVGDKFDPNRHEAVSMVPASGGASPNTLAHVLKTGFLFKDRVLRPAQVAVFMKAEAAEEAARAAEKVASESTRSI